MGIVPSPRPLSKEEFDKRWAAGARTMEELDPEFAEWFKYGHYGKKWISKIMNAIFYKKSIAKLKETLK